MLIRVLAHLQAIIASSIFCSAGILSKWSCWCYAMDSTLAAFRIISSYTFFLSSLQCNTVAMADNYPPRTEPNVEYYTCPEGIMLEDGDFTVNNKSYNEGRTSLFQA